MADHISPEKRSWNMRQIKSRDTAPEIAVRQILHKHNYRFRLNKRDLPGIPDIVLPKHKMIIFVHGCFWHRHIGCRRSNVPASKTDFWLEKFRRTVDRDKANQLKLKELGWNVRIVWECQTKNNEQLENLVLFWFVAGGE
ncbi:MAG: DNA mismatch endonuclease Vsr [Pyrinomonadaceae bacterium]|nr:DNA mismatch endonuclease Vsr [Pyrinomonadaceae bacterium]